MLGGGNFREPCGHVVVAGDADKRQFGFGGQPTRSERLFNANAGGDLVGAPEFDFPAGLPGQRVQPVAPSGGMAIACKS
jgi:hypothetical protein